MQQDVSIVFHKIINFPKNCSLKHSTHSYNKITTCDNFEAIVSEVAIQSAIYKVYGVFCSCLNSMHSLLGGPGTDLSGPADLCVSECHPLLPETQGHHTQRYRPSALNQI